MIYKPYRPAVIPLSHGLYGLLSDFRATAKAGRRIAVVRLRAGFRTDGASVPRFFWRVAGCPYDPDTMPAAIIHDGLYAGELLARSDCDAVFLYLLKRAPISKFRAFAFWAAVRLFGGLVWRRHTAQSVARARTRASVTLKEGISMSKRFYKLFTLLAVLTAGAALTGCQTVVDAEKAPEVALPLLGQVKDSTGSTVAFTNGYAMASGGWKFHARSPLWASESLQGLDADVGAGQNHVGIKLDRYSRDLSTNAVAMVGGIENSVCDVVGKVADAYVSAQTGGASAAASSLGSMTISAIAKKAFSSLSSGTNTTQQVADDIICNGTECAKCTDGSCTPTATGTATGTTGSN